MIDNDKKTDELIHRDQHNKTIDEIVKVQREHDKKADKLKSAIKILNDQWYEAFEQIKELKKK